MKTQRWCFTHYELNNTEVLSKCRGNDEFVSHCCTNGVRVIVYRNGKVSNRYADGTVGVTDRDRETANREDCLIRDFRDNPRINDLVADTWKRVRVVRGVPTLA